MSARLTYGRHFGPFFPNARRAAVVILIYPFEGQWHIPLTIRTHHLRDHAGQVSFPGGKQESDESNQEAALRELREELNCNTENVEMVGRLSDLYVYNSNFLVTPWVAAANAELEFEPNVDEVDGWFALSLSAVATSLQRGEKHIRRGAFHFSAPCFLWDGYDIWGATSMILSEFRPYLLNAMQKMP